MKSAVMEIVQQNFRPEFINRIDDIVVFHPLGTEQIRAIVDIQLGYLRKRLLERDIELDARRRGARLARRGGLRPGVRRAAAEARDPAADREPAGAGASCGASSGPGDRIRVTVDGRPAGLQKGLSGRGYTPVPSKRRYHRAAQLPGNHRTPMPFYEYECANCKFYTEVLQKITDAPLKKCPSCGKTRMKKLVSAPVFRLKGGGWYETDFKRDKENKRNLAVDKEPEASARSRQGRREGDAKPRRPSRAETKPPKPKPMQASESGSREAAGRRGRARRSRARSRPRRPKRKPAKRRAAPMTAPSALEPAALSRRGRARVAADPRDAVGHHVLVQLMDSTLLLLPAAYRPEALVGFRCRARRRARARRAARDRAARHRTSSAAGSSYWEGVLRRIPLVRSIYGGVKSFAESVFSQGNSFRKVVMIEYPRAGIWSIGFVTGGRRRGDQRQDRRAARAASTFRRRRIRRRASSSWCRGARSSSSR